MISDNTADIEDYLEEQDEQNDETQYVVPSYEDSTDSSYSEESYPSEEEDYSPGVINLVQSAPPQTSFIKCLGALNPNPEIHLKTPLPNIQVQVLPEKYSKPITAIAFIDTGSSHTVMKPHILPPEEWVPHNQYFFTADGKIFKIDLITRRKINIKFFPGCTLKIKVLGSELPGKDILLGFDAFYHTKNLTILPRGIKWKSNFTPWTEIPSLYELQNAPPQYSDIKEQLLQYCADSHDQFPHPSPLWKNRDFFISLPFKRNEDINPTKASHPGMNPEDLKLAREECAALLKQGLIEPTKSEWACQAFYVEKRSEIKRGKKRLVIDYKPLNHFLQNDKFPLPKPTALFAQLKGSAHVFSKFDLKAGFWQLGIQPQDRPKTAFCIPNAQYQWTVMPFGLKVAPSLFQKAMIKIFEPIINNALIYIDDILLFSATEADHQLLLAQFYQIVAQHGVMLSSKKSDIGITEVDFLGMHFKDGKYSPGPHIAQDLQKFPDDNLSYKQVQQFLGIVNFLRDFIPQLSHQTSHLYKMLKKNPPPWSQAQTDAVITLKRIAQNPPPLKIPDQGQRILQTDASEDYWGAILLEEVNGVRQYCGHTGGQFKDSEKHYHATYKEILAVKRGIEKFSFHLSPYHFIVEMDNTSFPKMLDPKKKLLPDAQLLRWKDWFSRYKFSVKHIKGPQNILADFLSRPQKTPPPHPQILYILTISDHHPSVPMVYVSKAELLPPNTALRSYADFQKYATENLYSWLHDLFNKTDLVPTPQNFSVLCPYTTIPFIQGPIPDELLWYVWSMTILHTSTIALAPLPVYHYICNSHNLQTNLVKLLTLFAPLHFWRGSLFNALTDNHLWHIEKPKQKRFSCVFFLRREYHAQALDGVYLKTNAQPWPQLLDWVKPDPAHLKELGLKLADFNKKAVKECGILGPVPSDDKAFDPLYQPEPHYVSSYYATSSSAPALPMDSQGNILQDSQDPYEDDYGLSQYRCQSLDKGPDPEDDPYLKIMDPLSYVQSGYDDDSDNNNLSPSHEPIYKD